MIQIITIFIIIILQAPLYTALKAFHLNEQYFAAFSIGVNYHKSYWQQLVLLLQGT